MSVTVSSDIKQDNLYAAAMQCFRLADILHMTQRGTGTSSCTGAQAG